MSQRAKPPERRKCADGIGSGEAPQVIDPVIKVILDTGAADEQRYGVDDDAHRNQYVLNYRFMAAFTVARHHHTHGHHSMHNPRRALR